MKPITYKKVLGKDGYFEALELWQGDQYITITLAGAGTHENYHRWEEVRAIIDKMQEEHKAYPGGDLNV